MILAVFGKDWQLWIAYHKIVQIRGRMSPFVISNTTVIRDSARVTYVTWTGFSVTSVLLSRWGLSVTGWFWSTWSDSLWLVRNLVLLWLSRLLCSFLNTRRSIVLNIKTVSVQHNKPNTLKTKRFLFVSSNDILLGDSYCWTKTIARSTFRKILICNYLLKNSYRL